MFRKLDPKGLALLFATISVCIMLPSLPVTASAAQTGNNFSHIVIIAMRTRNMAR